MICSITVPSDYIRPGWSYGNRLRRITGFRATGSYRWQANERTWARDGYGGAGNAIDRKSLI